MFLQSRSQNGSIWVLNPLGSLLCDLCEPENNLRTCYIQSHQNPSATTGFSTVNHRFNVSRCLNICIKKDSIAVKTLKSCCGGFRVKPSPPPSLQLGAHLQERGLLLHDAHQQCVNVVLQISDLRLQLLQLHLSLSQHNSLPLELGLLSRQLCLALHQQGHQFAVGQVVVRARSLCERLKTGGETGKEQIQWDEFLSVKPFVCLVKAIANSSSVS